MSSCLAKSAFVIGLTGGAELRSDAGESVTSNTSITSVMSGTIEDRMELGKFVSMRRKVPPRTALSVSKCIYMHVI